MTCPANSSKNGYGHVVNAVRREDAARACRRSDRMKRGYRRCDTAALADARCWRAAADCMCIFTVGLTPRLPSSFVSRALVVATAAIVRTPKTRAAHAVLSNLVASVGSSLTLIAGYRFILNAQSSAEAGVTFVALHAGIG